MNKLNLNTLVHTHKHNSIRQNTSEVRFTKLNKTSKPASSNVSTWQTALWSQQLLIILTAAYCVIKNKCNSVERKLTVKFMRIFIAMLSKLIYAYKDM